MNRRRKKDKGLPPRVYLKHGAYYFLPATPMRNPATGREQKWIRLCAAAEGESAMLIALAALKGDQRVLEGSMPFACAEFKAHMLGDYEKDTRDTYGRYLDVIAGEFEEFHASQVTTKDVAGFLRDNYRGSPNTAKKLAALMKKLFKFIIGELGLRQDNPIDQIDLEAYETERRQIIPTHAQVAAIRAAGFVGKDGRKTVSGPTLACLIDISYLCWQRAKDFRELKEEQIQDGRIRFKPSKTTKTSGLAVEIVVTPTIAAVLARARAIKAEHGIDSEYVFPAITGRHAGKPYKKSGLFSMWDRARERAKIADDIQFRDLRALAATDAAKRGETAEDIQGRLVHTDASTSRIYIKDVVPTVSEMDSKLPWNADNIKPDGR